MKNQLWESGRELALLKDAQPAYQFEYLSLHNTRNAWVRLNYVWQQIAFPISVAVYGFLINIGLEENRFFVLSGAFFSSAILLLIRQLTRERDQVIVRLYPRIITLELLLDYRFYRDYLSSRAGETGKRFIEECENLSATTTSELSRRVHECFERHDFRPGPRGFSQLDKFLIFPTIAVYFGLAAAILL